MDMDLDDLEFDNDKIRSFLKDRLNEIKAKNDRLEKTLSEREEYGRSLGSRSHLLRKRNPVEVSIAWKKIFNGKYSLGYRIKSGCGGKLDNFKIFLNWDSNHALHYEIHLFEDSLEDPTISCDKLNCKKVTRSLTRTGDLKEDAYIVITLDLPKFLDKSAYELSGIICVKKDDEDITLHLQTQQLSTMDVVDRLMNDCSVLDGAPKNLLTVLCCSEHSDLVLILSPEWKSNLDSTFEIHCSLTGIDTPKNCKKYYFAKRVSPTLDDSLLEVHSPAGSKSEIAIKVYSRNNETLWHFIHHLYNCITDVVIFPRILHENYSIKEANTLYSQKDVDEEKFKKFVNREITHAEDFLQKTSSIETYVAFRNHLASLERNTDYMFLKISQREKIE